ncbi:hotdog fold thioesterase [Luteimicrobium subarcticum]|uniref:Uncharacterized protein (TIGR00369 family) n=1 Tax=Luteimicrobium subarcticum TaxID=620910 RepID=A0A2M8W3H1_9MICO|nr:uncharacterized protein (TIGR00369 family) [Luteimicrobium subarcticum]
MTDTPTPQSPDPADPTWWQQAARGTLIERMGIVLVEVGAQRTVATMPVAGNTQPFGLLHGGASAALGETLGSVAAQVHAGPGRTVVGIELGATHHRAAREGVVTGTATAVHLGRTTASYEIVVTDDRDRRVSTVRLTCLILDRG